jgi:hypothetical protein
MKEKCLVLVSLLFFLANAEPPKFNDEIEVKANNATIKIGHASPCVVDWNEDGKKDLLLGQYDQGKINYFENIGTDEDPVLTSPVFLQAAGADISLSSY